MPVTLSTPPQLLAWSKNPIEVRLTSNDYLQEPGSAAVSNMVFPAAVFNNTTINFTWANADIDFRFVPAPDDTGTQLPMGDGSPAHVTAVVQWLRNNPYLDADFDIQQDVAGTTLLSSITMTAKKTGVNYNISNAESINPVLGTDTVSLTTTPGLNRAKKPGFAHFLQVWIKGAADPLYESSLILDSPETGVTTKNLAEILHPYLFSLGFDVPDLATVWQPCVNSSVEYYLRYAQIYGDTPTIKRAYKTGSYFAYLGGFSQLALGVIDRADQLQVTLLPHPLLYQYQRWFESYPRDNYIVKNNQPAFLYFINNRSVSEVLDVKVVMTFDVGPTQTIVIPGGNLDPYKKVCIACGYLALGLDTHTDSVSKVIGYTVQIIEHTLAEARSEVKTFTVDRGPDQYNRYILYSDSSGNFKTLRLNGLSTPETDITDTLANSYPDQNTPKAGDVKRFNVLATKTDAINTGYIDAVTYDDLEELLISNKAFRVIGNAMVPIVITTKKFSPAADGQNLNAVKIEYRLAYQETNYTGSSGNLIVPQINLPQNPLTE